MDETPGAPTPTDGEADTDAGTGGGPGKAVIAVIAVLAALAVAGLVVYLVRDDDEPTTVDTTTSTTTTSTTTTTEPDTTPSTEPAPDVDTATAVWPWASTAQRFEDPVAAARSFAVDYVGFTDPVMGEFIQGDSRSGEVEVRAVADGPATTVFVRQLGPDDSWWVLGSATANIEVDEPAALATISSPVTLAGRARAFEGTVNVQVRADGTEEPLATDFVTGRGDGTLGPFSKDVAFSSPGSGGGAVVFTTLSMEDGRVWEAGVVRVSFG
jgi:hypothetical protein